MAYLSVYCVWDSYETSVQCTRKIRKVYKNKFGFFLYLFILCIWILRQCCVCTPRENLRLVGRCPAHIMKTHSVKSKRPKNTRGFVTKNDMTIYVYNVHAIHFTNIYASVSPYSCVLFFSDPTRYHVFLTGYCFGPNEHWRAVFAH